METIYLKKCVQESLYTSASTITKKTLCKLYDDLITEDTLTVASKAMDA